MSHRCMHAIISPGLSFVDPPRLVSERGQKKHNFSMAPKDIFTLYKLRLEQCSQRRYVEMPAKVV